jgi:hypothetical protein
MGSFEIPSQHLPGRNEEVHEDLSQMGRFRTENLNRNMPNIDANVLHRNVL